VRRYLPWPATVGQGFFMVAPVVGLESLPLAAIVVSFVTGFAAGFTIYGLVRPIRD
jgi:hypothetical protein